VSDPQPSSLTLRRSTVLVADDHAIVMEGVVKLLKEHDFDVVGAVGDGHQLVDVAKKLRPDVIVTDLSMPGLSGLDVLARLKSERVDSKVVVLTMHNDSNLATRIMRAGARGFLLKQSAGEELVNAIHQVLQGRMYLTPVVTKDVIEQMASHADETERQLTQRQREVLRLIVEGRRMKEIATILNLSARTVESHKYEMMETLRVQSTAELVRYAIEHRLIID
jgi:two-component system, NarL family, response regulator NreC